MDRDMINYFQRRGLGCTSKVVYRRPATAKQLANDAIKEQGDDERRRTTNLVKSKLQSLTNEDKNNSIQQLLGSKEGDTLEDKVVSSLDQEKDRESKRIAHTPKPYKPKEVKPSPRRRMTIGSKRKKRSLPNNEFETNKTLKELLTLPVQTLKTILANSSDYTPMLAILQKECRATLSEAVRKLAEEKMIQAKASTDKPVMMEELEHLVDTDLSVDVYHMPKETIKALGDLLKLDLVGDYLPSVINSNLAANIVETDDDLSFNLSTDTDDDNDTATTTPGTYYCVPASGAMDSPDIEVRPSNYASPSAIPQNNVNSPPSSSDRSYRRCPANNNNVIPEMSTATGAWYLPPETIDKAPSFTAEKLPDIDRNVNVNRAFGESVFEFTGQLAKDKNYQNEGNCKGDGSTSRAPMFENALMSNNNPTCSAENANEGIPSSFRDSNNKLSQVREEYTSQENSIRNYANKEELLNRSHNPLKSARGKSNAYTFTKSVSLSKKITQYSIGIDLPFSTSDNSGPASNHVAKSVNATARANKKQYPVNLPKRRRTVEAKGLSVNQAIQTDVESNYCDSNRKGKFSELQKFMSDVKELGKGSPFRRKLANHVTSILESFGSNLFDSVGCQSPADELASEESERHEFNSIELQKKNEGQTITLNINTERNHDVEKIPNRGNQSNGIEQMPFSNRLISMTNTRGVENRSQIVPPPLFTSNNSAGPRPLMPMRGSWQPRQSNSTHRLKQKRHVVKDRFNRVDRRRWPN